MARIEVSREIGVPVGRVWEALADIGSHPAWMRDARSIEFLGSQTRGVGTRFQVETRVGPFRTLDLLEVTEWEEGRSIEVAHRGSIGGTGVLSVEGSASRARVTWKERLEVPWRLGGPPIAWLAVQVLAVIWRGNLARLEALVTSP